MLLETVPIVKPIERLYKQPNGCPLLSLHLFWSGVDIHL